MTKKNLSPNKTTINNSCSNSRNINKMRGNNAEQLALVYLQNKGLKLIKQNFYSRLGEIDLIMQENNTTIFVEVKLRNTLDNAIISITKHKQQKLFKTAKYYLMKLGYEVACRFDAVCIDNNGNCQWLQNIIQF